MDRTWDYYCGLKKAVYKKQLISLPVHSREEVVAQFLAGITQKTKVIFISHITSSTALRLPVEEICAAAKDLGILTIVDGAHAPAQVPLDLSILKADIYTGACHKWMMTPKGCSFLYVNKEQQDKFDPLVVSWGYKSAAPSHSRFLDYHQMQGTRDFSAFLTVPAALKFMSDNNWTEVATDSRLMVRENYSRFCDLLGTQPVCPVSEEFLVQMCSIPIRCDQPEQLHTLLFDKYRIEVPVMRQEQHIFLRFSINAFNTPEHLDILEAALKDIMQTTSLIKPR